MILAESVWDVWRPGIGDPTPIGWITVAAYFVAAVGCLRAAWREPGAARPAAFWLGLAAFMLALGVNKQLDLQSLVTVVGRRVVRAQGWNEQRRALQLAFIAAVAAGCVALLVISFRMARRTPGRRLALAGIAFLLAFVMIRAASFHHVDAFLTARLGGMKWNWILELGGIGLIGLSAFRAGREVRPAR